MKDLIEKLGQAMGPSRVTDFELHLAIVGDPLWPSHDMKGRITNPHSRMSDYLASFRDVIDADDQDFDFPRYTASIDAALNLAPCGGFWSASHGRVHSGEPIGAARLFTPLTELLAEAEAMSVPLAICIAALKARTPAANLAARDDA